MGTHKGSPRPNRRKEKPCRWCGALYWGRKHGYCSIDCGEAARAEHLAKAEITPAMIDGLAASPLTQPGESHHTAREWSLIAPSGRRYQFRNLAHFVREHRELFTPEDVTPRADRPTSLICRATTGLGQLHPERKMKKRPGCWKGWRWAE